MKTCNCVVTDADVQQAKKLEEDPEQIMKLVDLIFFGHEWDEVIPS